jgi:hypothetical protein
MVEKGRRGAAIGSVPVEAFMAIGMAAVRIISRA